MKLFVAPFEPFGVGERGSEASGRSTNTDKCGKVWRSVMAEASTPSRVGCSRMQRQACARAALFSVLTGLLGFCDSSSE